VLVVDESATFREVLEKMLETMGLRVETVSTGMECLHRLHNPGSQGAYDLVISDWKMPGMDGIELVKIIKNFSAGVIPRILMITGYGADDLKTASGELMIDGWLEKPVTLASLSAAIEKSLGVEGHKKKLAGSLLQIAIPPAIAGVRVLVVEDNELNRQVAGEILAAAGVLVSYAGNGIEAVAAVKDGHFDAVLMDIQMPLMDGHTAASRIRAWEKKINRQRRVPIIAMTAHAFREEYKMSLQAGMDDHLTKPINAADLLSVLANWTARDTARHAELAQAFGPEPEPEPVINTAEAIARIDGNLELYIKILKIYKNNLPPPQEIIQHFKKGDVHTARRQAHTVKGMSAQIGASGLHGIAAVLEEAIRAGDEANVEKHAVLFVEELEKVFTSIDRFVRTAECVN